MAAQPEKTGKGQPRMGRTKKSSLLMWVLVILFTFRTCCFSGLSESSDLSGISTEERAAKVEMLLTQILERKLADSGLDSLQAWVDGPVTETAEGTGGWYLIAMRQNGRRFGESRCREKLDAAAAEEPRSISKRLRLSLTRTALGMDPSFAQETLGALAAEKTLMPLVFGLHLANNGISSPLINREELVSRLLTLQLSDGGWAVIGNVCDVDCTAMTLQALAPLVDTEDRVRTAAERGLAVLSRIQQENGGYLGMGQESAESCAQVLLALSCLGIDGERDERFLKNGNSVMEALLRFRREDGSFSHSLGQAANETATVQTFYTLVGMLRFLRGQGSYYLFDMPEQSMEETEKASAETADSGVSARLLIYGGISVAGLLACCIAWFRRRRNWRTYVFIVTVTLLAAFAASRVQIQSPENYYAGKPAAGPVMQTYISIRCDTVSGRSEYAPADGIILPETEICLPEESTAFDQLAETVRIHRIQMEYDGTTAGAYVRGIGYLYEYDFGNLSGWMYRVNGEFADTGASMCPLKEGDRVEWIYSTNIGKDVNP